MLRAGQRPYRVRIERQAAADDGYGNTLASWDAPVSVAERWAAFKPQYGREAVEAGRLEATMQGTLTLLRDNATSGITASDRVVFQAGPFAGTICQIRSIVPTGDNAEIL